MRKRTYNKNSVKGKIKYFKNKSRYPIGYLLLSVGIFLLFRAVSSQVSSTPMSLTSVFDMGTGGPSSLSTPTVFDYNSNKVKFQ